MTDAVSLDTVTSYLKMAHYSLGNVKKQPTIAPSSCEAEYIVMTTAIHAGWYFLRKLLLDIQRCSKQPNNILHADNQGAKALAKNPVNHQRTKHIDIKYHFIRLEVEQGVVNLNYIRRMLQI